MIRSRFAVVLLAGSSLPRSLGDQDAAVPVVVSVNERRAADSVTCTTSDGIEHTCRYVQSIEVDTTSSCYLFRKASCKQTPS